MTTTLTRPDARERPAVGGDPARRVDWRRLRTPAAGFAVGAVALAALGQALGTVVAGRIADHPTGTLVGWLALFVVGAATVDTAGRVVWAGVVDRAEGRLRGDLLSAALQQPLEHLTEQAVGEVLDRVDDDTHEVGTLLRQQIWMAMRTGFASVPMWLVAGFTWWPAFVLFPLVGAVTVWVMRPALVEIARRKVIEEAAWTDHAAALEEGVAGRDDLRTSLGQAFAVRRLAQLSADVHEKFRRVLMIEARLAIKVGLLLHGLLAAIAVCGVALVSGDHLGVARLVTLFLVTTIFVGQINNLAHQLPDIQAGLGAVLRLRQLLAVEAEPEGGEAVPSGALDLRIRHLDFAYNESSFALRDVTLYVEEGHTLALVGRTGSGKSTLASLLSRAAEPPPGTIFLGGADITTLDLHELRRRVGVVTQRTEILAGSLADNITLFASVPREEVEAAVAELGLTDWVAGLPDGLDTLLGPGGTTLSAGEEQLVAFARLLVRHVQVVVLDEATARMDPVTEARVVAAADRLISGRTGILVAHRLSTIERAEAVAVLDHGTVIQHGPRDELAVADGPFRRLLAASDTEGFADADLDPAETGTAVGGRRRTGTPPERPEVGSGSSLARGTWNAFWVRPWWGAWSVLLFLGGTIFAPLGAITGFVWGKVVERLEAGESATSLVVVLVVSLLVAPILLADAFRRYPRWWIEVMLRVRMSVLLGQVRSERLPRTPPGEVVARSMDADRYARYADRWVDFVNGLLIAAITMVAGGTWLAGGVLLVVMLTSALASSIGRPIAGRSAARSSAARARFGRAVVSAVESARTVKLAGRTPQVHAHLSKVDDGRVEAAVFEHRVQAVLDGVPIVMVQVGVVAAWALYLWDVWGLATALLVATAVNGFDWFGRVAGAVVTEAPGVRAWQQATARFAGGRDLMAMADGIDLVAGEAPEPATPARVPLQRLELAGYTAVHDDGTVGATGIDLVVERGELVLLVGQVGSGKSSLLSSLAGLIDHRGSLRWNGQDVTDPETFLRPGQVGHVAQVPRVLSGTFADNILLGHDRQMAGPVETARMAEDVADAGGPDAVIGHRGVRLSGGQVQRLALARALATDAELLLADDVSSALDAATEIELWAALRERHTTVIGATSKRAALAQADRVVVLVDGEVAAVGPWSSLAGDWGHLAG
ncbi:MULTISPECIES: ABC transporter ATP-binding protein [unclassified Nocardioides]|uniref:ATP-binding cassette domain-containing protein n=1 Tax=unclassified Nocardioides TaxID=2615069 RepID=UPI001154DDDA|nr:MULTISPECIES: ABC transporter ATP-binding protein [unclassified Nocardioides]TQK72577.1 ABC-type multidrug transport system fused ATPase/permease subunit [Nocardioides sp. SLBN-35]WGY03218.1 ABC transporter ATP-binding protein [Nocardioides sp. QY071]